MHRLLIVWGYALCVSVAMASFPSQYGRCPHSTQSVTQRFQPTFDPLQDAVIQQAISNVELAVKQVFEQQGTVGLSVGVVYDQDLIWHMGLGQQDRDNASSAITPDSIFRIGSISKVFTMLSMMKSREMGLLSLDDPIVKHIPQFSIRGIDGDNGGKITLRQLATHLAGMPRENPCTDCMISNEEAFARIADFTTILPTDTLPVYSNLGFNILGNTIASINNGAFEDVVNKLIIDPLGLTNSGANITKANRRFLALPYECGESGLDPSNAACVTDIAPCPDCLSDFGWGNPAGGMFSSARDLGKVMSLVFNNTNANTNEGVLSSESIRETLLPRFIQTDREGGFGLTWELYKMGDYWLRTKRGDVNGYASEIVMVPELKLGIVALSNVVEHAQLPAQTMAEILVEAFDTASRYTAPRTKTPASLLITLAGSYQTSFGPNATDTETIVNVNGDLVSPVTNNALVPSILLFVPQLSNDTHSTFRLLPLPGNAASCFNIQLDDWYQLVRFENNNGAINFSLDIFYGQVWKKTM
eukprot:m.197996 g.197996  ORF g.197996 m.197996 type:complete len:530 (-) comp32675_c0_seq1:89-1678(-)